MAETTEERFATVKVFVIQGKGKKTYKKGEKVTASSFPEGNFEALIKSGHLIEGKPQPVDPTIESEKEKAAEAHAIAEKKELDAATKEAEDLGVLVIAGMKTDDIKKAISAKKAQDAADAKLAEAKATCDELGIQYDQSATIDDLNKLIADYEAKNTKSFVNSKGDTIVVKSIDDITRTELVAELEKAKVPFDKNGKKPALFTQWMEIK